MKNENFNIYVDMYKYIHATDFTDYTISNKFGIQFGLFQYSLVSGEAQKAILAANKQVPEEIKDLFNETNAQATKLFTKKPFSLGETFLLEYREIFESLIAATTSYQKSELLRVKKEWEEFLEVKVQVHLEKKIEAMLLARFIQRDLSKKEQCLLSSILHGSANGEALFVEKVNNTNFTNVYLSGNPSYLPGGRKLELRKQFPDIYGTSDDDSE